jgi:signal peptidase I
VLGPVDRVCGPELVQEDGPHVKFRKLGLWLLAIAALGALLFSGMSYGVYLIHTGSMEPTIPIGSAVIVERCPVHVGDIITFTPLGGSSTVTHRLIGINPNGTLRTKGDGNATPDVNVVTRADVVGHVVAAPRYVGGVIVFAFHTTLGVVFDALFLLVLVLLLTGFEQDNPTEAAHRSARTSS